MVTQNKHLQAVHEHVKPLDSSFKFVLGIVILALLGIFFAAYNRPNQNPVNAPAAFSGQR
jgi:hypothetical protein